MDDILKIIKMSDYKIVDQLLQTPSKISIFALLMNSSAHSESLMRVLDQAFVESDMHIYQFSSVVRNITSCNNLSFCDDEFPDEGWNHNLALHLPMNCKNDSLSNVLIDNGYELNVIPRSTLMKLKYQGTPMRPSGIIVKVFDGSRKSFIGEVDLPIHIGPHLFQITFQSMDIVPAYSCFLGRSWIHEAGAVTSTLYLNFKFVRGGKVVIING